MTDTVAPTGAARTAAAAGDRVFAGTRAGCRHPHPARPRRRGDLPDHRGHPRRHRRRTRSTPAPSNFVDYVWPLVFGTLLAAVLALSFATPLSIGVALFISHYAPRRLAARSATSSTCWPPCPASSTASGASASSAPQLVRRSTTGWPTTSASSRSSPGPASATGRTILTVGMVLAIMILPIITAISPRDLPPDPRLHEEAALALGATRWEMIRMTVFPYARSGIVSAAMLGLGRALGETMAVAMVLSASGVRHVQPDLSHQPSTIAANIALKFPRPPASRSTS